MALPELPAARRARFAEQFHLGETEVELLTLERETADYFEAALGDGATPSDRGRYRTGY